MAKSVRRPSRVMLLVATRKGAFLFHGDPARRQWRLDGPHFLGWRYPGIRFRVIDEQDRIRPHMKLFVGEEPAESLAQPIHPGQDVHILQALSGGVRS